MSCDFSNKEKIKKGRVVRCELMCQAAWRERWERGSSGRRGHWSACRARPCFYQATDLLLMYLHTMRHCSALSVSKVHTHNTKRSDFSRTYFCWKITFYMISCWRNTPKKRVDIQTFYSAGARLGRGGGKRSQNIQRNLFFGQNLTLQN